MHIVETVLRFIFAWLDKIVAWAINLIYDLLIKISDITVFNDSIIQTLGSRISIILGIVMLFKVSFSLVNYALNPDSFSDKEKGAGKLVTNIIVMLVMLVSVNFIFKQAFYLQGKVIENNVLENIIFGVGSRKVDNKNAGNEMAFYIYSAFMKPNEDSILKERCKYIYSGLNSFVDESGNTVDVNNENIECLTKLQDATNMRIMTNFSDAINEHNSQKLLDYDLIMAEQNSEFLFDYIPIISTVCGIIVFLVLIQFCIDIAIRSVKLGFLQLIAPIPIISYIDPKSGKSGVFSKWLKVCVSTYLDLFVRLLALFFAIFVVTALLNNSMVSISTGQPVTFWDEPFVKVAIILGTLLFAKQMPQLISDITGIKVNGGFTLNPMKRIQQAPLVGWAGSQLAGRTAGAVESMLHDQTGHRGRAAMAGWSGAGDALHGKVPFTGTKPGSASVRSIHTGRQAGYEVATGSKMKRRMPFSAHYAEKGKEEIDNLKKNVRAPLQQELSRIGLQKQETSNVYKNLNEQLGNAQTAEEKEAIRAKMRQAQDRYQSLSAAEGKVTGDISTVNDQIKDLERAYDIDKSTAQKLHDIEGKISDGKVSPGSYIDDLPPLTDSAPSSTSSTSSRTTVGGVNVSSPNSSGERTTDSGIILPSGTRTDDQR